MREPAISGGRDRAEYFPPANAGRRPGRRSPIGTAIRAMRKLSRKFFPALLAAAALLPSAMAAPAHAAAPPQGVSLQIPGLTVHGDANSWTIVALLTFLTLLPAIVLS